MKVLSLRLQNFRSYREATLDLSDFTVVVGLNASGKSNAVAALKLLRDIPRFGLSTAIARQGGFDQLRHRSQGRPYDPAIEIAFLLDEGYPVSYYEIRLGAVHGKRYEVKLERGEVYGEVGTFIFSQTKGQLTGEDSFSYENAPDVNLTPYPMETAQSAVTLAVSYGALLVGRVLSSLQVLQIDPARVGELQDPAAGDELEPEGSNAASCFEALDPGRRGELVDELSAIMPNLVNIEPRTAADKVTLVFTQEVSGKKREFYARQMSDGTLRTFGILLGLLQKDRPVLMAIEEPEIAIHLGALRTLVEMLRQHSEDTQVLITTHSADIIDAVEAGSLRVVWSEEGASRIAPVADHTLTVVREGLSTPGELLRSDALDPAVT